MYTAFHSGNLCFNTFACSAAIKLTHSLLHSHILALSYSHIWIIVKHSFHTDKSTHCYSATSHFFIVGGGGGSAIYKLENNKRMQTRQRYIRINITCTRDVHILISHIRHGMGRRATNAIITFYTALTAGEKYTKTAHSSNNLFDAKSTIIQR